MTLLTKDAALKRLQSEEIDILDAFAQFCERHQLVWFLDSGTALGAARHDGFIPWDDDIDVGMLREDYDRLICLTREHDEIAPGYSLHTFDNTDGYAAMFAKVYKEGTCFQTKETIAAGCQQGIFIDVFPYDAAPSDPDVFRFNTRHAHFWQMVSYLYHSQHVSVSQSGFRKVLLTLGCAGVHCVLRLFLSRKVIRDKFERWARAIPDSDWFIAYAYPVSQPFSRSVLVPTAKHVFGEKEYPVPCDLESYLTICYGDWRKLPDPEDRKTHLPVLLRFSDGSYYRSE